MIDAWIQSHLFDEVPQVIGVLDRDHRVVKANRRFSEAFGDWRGRCCYEILLGRSSACQECAVDRCFLDGRSRATSEDWVDRTGHHGHFVVRLVPVAKDEAGSAEVAYVLIMATDVTSSEQLELEHQILFERVPCYVAVLDRRLRIERANQLLRETFGEQVGGVCHEVYKQRSTPCPGCPALRSFEDGKVHTARSEGHRADGQAAHYVVTTAPLVQQDSTIEHVIEILHDVTEMEKLQREMLDAERLAAVGQTVAGLAHGVKNILTGLEGGLYLVRWGLEEDRRDKLQQGWEMLDRNFDRITTFVREFLSFAKGRVPEVEATDPNRIAEEVVALFGEAAREKGVTIEAELQADIPNANLDVEGIHKALSNLVSNAIDACLLSDREDRRVVVRTRDLEGRLELEVEDNGCGMDCEIKSKVFTSFFSTKGTKGTGLGLLETKKVVQEHGGSVGIESTPGFGSTFQLILPRSRLPRPAADESGQAREGEIS